MLKTLKTIYLENATTYEYRKIVSELKQKGTNT